MFTDTLVQGMVCSVEAGQGDIILRRALKFDIIEAGRFSTNLPCSRLVLNTHAHIHTPGKVASVPTSVYISQ